MVNGRQILKCNARILPDNSGFLNERMKGSIQVIYKSCLGQHDIRFRNYLCHELYSDYFLFFHKGMRARGIFRKRLNFFLQYSSSYFPEKLDAVGLKAAKQLDEAQETRTSQGSIVLKNEKNNPYAQKSVEVFK